MRFTPVPFNSCYWVEPEKFMAGNYPGDPNGDRAAARIRFLLDAGVRHFIDLTSPGEGTRSGPLVPYAGLAEDLGRGYGGGVTFRQIPIPDMGVPDRALMSEILDLVDEKMGAGGAVYVHCLGGYGRTGTVVGCWLLRSGRATPANVLETIEELRKAVRFSLFPSPQTREQRDFVVRWRG
jgi:hypothetical protein